MRRFEYLSIMAIALIIMGACARTEKTEGVIAEIEAAQMQGREAARWFLNQDLSDSISRSEKAEDARGPKYRMEAQGKKEAAAAFDSAFVSTVRAVNPKLRY